MASASLSQRLSRQTQSDFQKKTNKRKLFWMMGIKYWLEMVLCALFAPTVY